MNGLTHFNLQTHANRALKPTIHGGSLRSTHPETIAGYFRGGGVRGIFREKLVLSLRSNFVVCSFDCVLVLITVVEKFMSGNFRDL